MKLINKYYSELTIDPEQSEPSFLRILELYLQYVDKNKMSVEEAVECAWECWLESEENSCD
jgi:hypothetical protein